MDTELNETVARVIGWQKRSDGEWLNFWGADVRCLPDFSGDPIYADVVVRAFEPSLQTRMDGTYEAFALEYRSDMTPKEICELGVKTVRQFRPDRFR